MRRYTVIGLAVLSILPLAAVIAQDDDLAAQRARIANQRIEAEAERRAEEERLRQQQAADAALRDAQAAGATAAATEQAGMAASDADAITESAAAQAPPAAADTDRAAISEALEQLRELGELRDAGYVTDEEFERIKARILDSKF